MRNKYYTAALACVLLAHTALFAQASLNKTVDELLNLDAQEALANAKQKNKPAVPDLFSNGMATPAKTAPRSKANSKNDIPPKELDTIAVVSMYGVGDALQAVVTINGQTLTGVRVGGTAQGYTVESMAGRCIQFVANQPQKNQIARVNKCYQPRAVPASNGQNLTRSSPNNALQGSGPLPIPIPMPMFSNPAANGNYSVPALSGPLVSAPPVSAPTLPAPLPTITTPAPTGTASNPNANANANANPSQNLTP